MTRKSGRRRESSWLWASLVVTLCVAANPLRAEEALASESSTKGASRLEREPLPPGPPPQQVFDVPYAVFVDLLLANLADRQEAGLVDEWARSQGLDPASALVQDLLTLAVELERRHPRGLSSEERQQIAEQFAGDEEDLQRWARDRRTGRFRAAGIAFGHWLQARRAEGYPPEFLIERLLSRYAAAVARVAIEVVKTEGIPEGRKRLQHEVRAFEEGLRTALERVPERFRVATNPEH